MSDTLFHYTTLDKLALILKSRSMMLRPITKMDDLLEDPGDVFRCGRYVFVSSWMNEETESIAMWKLYSTMESGVRIEMKRNPFMTYKVGPNDIKARFSDVDIDLHRPEGDYIMPFEKCIDNGVFLIEAAPDKILEKVEYVKNPRDLTKHSVIINAQQIIIAWKDFGKYKSKYWEFQSEERYILRFLPSDVKKLRDNKDITAVEDFWGNITNPSIITPEHQFLQIENSAFEDMIITTSPMFTEGNRVLLEALREMYNPPMRINHSDLEGKINL